MAQLVQVNCAGREIATPIPIDRSRRRLPQVISAHVDRTRPFMIAIQRDSELATPIGESFIGRGWKVPPVRNEAGEIIKNGVPNPWPRKYIAEDATVVVVYLPHGGGGAGGGGGQKSPLQTVAGIAGLALLAFAGPLAAIATPALGLAGASIAGISAATLVQGSAALGEAGFVSLSRRHEVPARSHVDDLAEHLRDARRDSPRHGWANLHQR